MMHRTYRRPGKTPLFRGTVLTYNGFFESYSGKISIRFFFRDCFLENGCKTFILPHICLYHNQRTHSFQSIFALNPSLG